MELSWLCFFILRSNSDLYSNSERTKMFTCYRLYFINFATHSVASGPVLTVSQCPVKIALY